MQEPLPVYHMSQQYAADGRLAFWHKLGADHVAADFEDLAIQHTLCRLMKHDGMISVVSIVEHPFDKL